MEKGKIVYSAFALLLGGCDLVRTMLPRHGTTEAEARTALKHCEIDPVDIAWSVDSSGTFAFGRKAPDATPMTEAQIQCLTRWIDDNRIKVAFIGWEAAPTK